MRVITYLGFTVLSIVIQFCVMDYIQEKLQFDDKPHHDPNITTQKKSLRKDSNDLLNDFKTPPHALYYKMVKSRSISSKVAEGGSTGNTTLPESSISTTEVSATILDMLYDENTTDVPTTDTYYTSTELDNVTETTFFDTKNGSSDASGSTAKTVFGRDCACNLMYQICDINCCCDNECTDAEHAMFDCYERGKASLLNNCFINLVGGHGDNSLFDNLFCVAKANLPEIRRKQQLAITHKYYQWKSNGQPSSFAYTFDKKLYKPSDPVWLLKNGTVYYLDMAAPMVNSYCGSRAPIRFLKEESVNCIVKLRDLEMFHIVRNSEGGGVVSPTERTFNSSIMNCSTLHCTNWTILVCNTLLCTEYNKSLHEVTCTENVCTNLALKVDYTFYYYNSQMVNATIKLYVENVSTHVPFLTQEINVKFVMTNITEGRVVKFSGNPGYVSDKPIIVSYAERNHTDNFFNSTSDDKNWILFPENNHGLCVLSNISNNIVKFGLNKRTKCRVTYTQTIKTNSSACKDIQDKINLLTRLNYEVAISPFGNPFNVADEDWVKLELVSKIKESPYGEYKETSSKLYCYNLVTRFSFVFYYTVKDEKHSNQYQVVAAKYDDTGRNVSFKVTDVSTVITIDINFVDVTKSNGIEYAGSPHLDIHLPRDFFFPFPSNKSCINVAYTNLLLILYSFVMVLQIK